MGLVKGLTTVSPFFAILLELVEEIGRNYNIMYISPYKKIDKILQNVSKWVEFFVL